MARGDFKEKFRETEGTQGLGEVLIIILTVTWRAQPATVEKVLEEMPDRSSENRKASAAGQAPLLSRVSATGPRSWRLWPLLQTRTHHAYGMAGQWAAKRESWWTL